jgi:hypothetical protein
MTAPRFICRNTKKALAERGPSIHDEKSHPSIFRNSAFATFSSVERGMSSTK